MCSSDLRQSSEGDYDAEANPEGLLCKPCSDLGDGAALGERVAVPEVSQAWDPIERWREVSRWRWREAEHNNILEARAGLASASLVAKQPSSWGRRVLMISDSQVTIGAFSKGRSSVKVLNMLARRLAALAFGCRIKFYWRYMRTHRNHADGPSRGFPLGVAPKDGAPVKAEPLKEKPVWSQLPGFFYQRTRG